MVVRCLPEESPCNWFAVFVEKANEESYEEVDIICLKKLRSEIPLIREIVLVARSIVRVESCLKGEIENSYQKIDRQ